MHPRHYALRYPERAAAIQADTGETLTYGELEARANQGAHALRRLGVSNGDVVAVWLPNTIDFFEAYWAAQRAGVYIVPISTALTADEAAYILADSGAKLLVTNPMVRAAVKLVSEHRLPGLRQVLTMGEPIGTLLQWRHVISREVATSPADERAGFHMVYSSGTTGRPKGVRLPLTGGPVTEPHMLANRSRTLYGVDESTIYLSPAPLYHAAPLAFTTSTHRLGGTVVVMRKFDPEATLAAIAQYRVTVTQMVPTMFVRLLHLSDATRAQYDLSSLLKVIHAAAPCPVDIKRRMMEWLGPIIYEYYGGSEGNGSTFIPPEEWLRKPGSVGRANWGTIHICGDDGAELRVGEPGLVYFEGGWDFAYLNDPDKTRESRHPQHWSWSTLGDVGYLDEDGYLFLTDRKSFVIISGGVNVYPQETENLLVSHPKIADAAVIGVPDADLGEAVKAVVQPLDWRDANAQFAAEITAYCREHLSPIKVPRSIDFERELPRHDTGKLYKRLIRNRYWAGRDKRIG